MDKRTRYIVILFGAAMAYAAYSSVIGPNVVDPLFSIQDEIAKLEEEKDGLLEKQQKTEAMIDDFASFCNRNGSFNVLRIEHELRQRLDVLLNEYKLEDTDVSPNEPRISRKTNIETMKVTVKGEGTFENAVKFLKSVYELPYMVRVGNTKLTPVRSRKNERGKKKQEYVNITVPLEIMKLPRQQVAAHVDKDSLEPVAEFVRHENRDYSTIWSKTPFTQYIVYPPLELSVKQSKITVQEGRSCNLEAVAKGGDGDYEFDWSGAGVKRPNRKTTPVDTDSPGDRSYTVTVTDGQGEVARATVDVSIEKKPEPKQQVARGRPERPKRPDPKPPEPTFPQRDPEGARMKVVMALTSRAGDRRKSEVMVLNERSNQTEYYAIGDDFDGGQLVFVHNSGALARHKMSKENDLGYFAYPLGTKVADGLEAQGLDEFPRLQWAADWFREQDEKTAAAEPKNPEDAPGKDAPGKDATGKEVSGTEPGADGKAPTDGKAATGHAGGENAAAVTAAAKEDSDAKENLAAKENAAKENPAGEGAAPKAANKDDAGNGRPTRGRPTRGRPARGRPTSGQPKGSQPTGTQPTGTQPTGGKEQQAPAATPKNAGQQNAGQQRNLPGSNRGRRNTANNRNQARQEAAGKEVTPKGDPEKAAPANRGTPRESAPAGKGKAEPAERKSTDSESSKVRRTRTRSRRPIRGSRRGVGERKRMRPGSRGGQSDKN